MLHFASARQEDVLSPTLADPLKREKVIVEDLSRTRNHLQLVTGPHDVTSLFRGYAIAVVIGAWATRVARASDGMAKLMC